MRLLYNISSILHERVYNMDGQSDSTILQIIFISFTKLHTDKSQENHPIISLKALS